MKDAYIKRAKKAPESERTVADQPKTSQSIYQEFKSRRFAVINKYQMHQLPFRFAELKATEHTFHEKSQLIGEEWRNLNVKNTKTTKANILLQSLQ